MNGNENTPETETKHGYINTHKKITTYSVAELLYNSNCPPVRPSILGKS